jgi:hypothetical protein
MNCVMKKAVKNFFWGIGTIVLLFGLVIFLAYLSTVSNVAVGAAIVISILAVVAWIAYDTAYDTCLEKVIRGIRYDD